MLALFKFKDNNLLIQGYWQINGKGGGRGGVERDSECTCSSTCNIYQSTSMVTVLCLMIWSRDNIFLGLEFSFFPRAPNILYSARLVWGNCTLWILISLPCGKKQLASKGNSELSVIKECSPLAQLFGQLIHNLGACFWNKVMVNDNYRYLPGNLLWY